MYAFLHGIISPGARMYAFLPGTSEVGARMYAFFGNFLLHYDRMYAFLQQYRTGMANFCDFTCKSAQAHFARLKVLG